MLTSEHEDPLPSLGQAEVLGVQTPPCGASLGSSNHTCVSPSGPFWRNEGGIASDKSCQEGAEGIIAGREHAGDVFPEDIGWGFPISASNIVNCICDPDELQSQVAAVVGKRLPQPSYGETL